jgi:hypothetical protein
MPCFFLNATFPDLAQRHWLLLRRTLLQGSGLGLDRRRFWRIDTGNYRASRASAYAGTALAAMELGDREMAQACLAALDEECSARHDGSGYYRPDASVWAHAVELFARCGATGAFRRLIETPRQGQRMRLDRATYPDVLVASAAEHDGVLRAVLFQARLPAGARSVSPGSWPAAATAATGRRRRRSWRTTPGRRGPMCCSMVASRYGCGPSTEPSKGDRHGLLCSDCERDRGTAGARTAVRARTRRVGRRSAGLAIADGGFR